MPDSPETPDERVQELVRILSEAEWEIRDRIRRLRGPRTVLESTSDLYASVVERAIDRERTDRFGMPDGHSGAAGGPLPGTAGPASQHERRWWNDLQRFIEQSVTEGRRAARGPSLSGSAELDRILDSSRSDVSPLHLAEFRRALENAIGGLNADDREILYLRMKGNAWASVAAATGFSEEACRQRWVRMVAELRARWPGD
jgi:hypothetical protein